MSCYYSTVDVCVRIREVNSSAQKRNVLFIAGGPTVVCGDGCRLLRRLKVITSRWVLDLLGIQSCSCSGHFSQSGKVTGGIRKCCQNKVWNYVFRPLNPSKSIRNKRWKIKIDTVLITDALRTEMTQCEVLAGRNRLSCWHFHLSCNFFFVLFCFVWQRAHRKHLEREIAGTIGHLHSEQIEERFSNKPIHAFIQGAVICFCVRRNWKVHRSLWNTLIMFHIYVWHHSWKAAYVRSEPGEDKIRLTQVCAYACENVLVSIPKHKCL